MGCCRVSGLEAGVRAKGSKGLSCFEKEGRRSGNSVQHLAGPGSLAGQSKRLGISPDHRAQTRP